ncbi:MAG: sulfotransferase, partial [Candidatus Limnocylindrales bacterium]
DPTKPVRGESSPKYSKDPIFPGVPERMHALIPEARLIYLVRDPIERLLSHYHVIALQGWERRNLAEALGDLSPSNRYLAPGLYAHQLEQYRAIFAADRIHVATLDALQRDPTAEMGRILEFLGLPVADAATLDLSAHNRSAPKRAVTPNGRRLQRRLGRRSLHLAGRIPGLRTVVYRPMSRPTLDPALRARLEAFYAADQAVLRELLA